MAASSSPSPFEQALAHGDLSEYLRRHPDVSLDVSTEVGGKDPIWAVLREAQRGGHDAATWQRLWEQMGTRGFQGDCPFRLSFLARRSSKVAFDGPEYQVSAWYREPYHLRQGEARATLLTRLMDLGATEAALGLLAMSPQLSTGGDHSVWTVVHASTDPRLVAALDATDAHPLPAERSTAQWLSHGATHFPHLKVWDRLPDWADKGWQWVLDRGMPMDWSWVPWLQARPQDWPHLRDHMPAAAFWAPLFQDALEGNDALLRFALADPHLAASARWPTLMPHRVGWESAAPLPPATPAQWLLHHHPRPDPSEPSKVSVEQWEAVWALARAAHDPLQGVPYGWGELMAQTYVGPEYGNSLWPLQVWRSAPDWIAPHPQTGRTPLWSANSPDAWDYWLRAGCDWAHCDAQGEQAFATLVAKTLQKNDAASTQWIVDAWAQGAPTQGMAQGRTVEEWVSGHKKLANAWLKAHSQHDAGAQLPQGLHRSAEAMRLDQVRRLLKGGADRTVLDRQGRTPLMAALTALAGTDMEQRKHVALLQALKTGPADAITPQGEPLMAFALRQAHCSLKALTWLVEEHMDHVPQWPVTVRQDLVLRFAYSGRVAQLINVLSEAATHACFHALLQPAVALGQPLTRDQRQQMFVAQNSFENWRNGGARLAAPEPLSRWPEVLAHLPERDAELERAWQTLRAHGPMEAWYSATAMQGALTAAEAPTVSRRLRM